MQIARLVSPLPSFSVVLFLASTPTSVARSKPSNPCPFRKLWPLQSFRKTSFRTDARDHARSHSPTPFYTLTPPTIQTPPAILTPATKPHTYPPLWLSLHPTLTTNYLSSASPLKNWLSAVTGVFVTTAMNSGPGVIAATLVSIC